jgi:hypothetical protein
MNAAKGFSLYALCHHFGLRGRAMARSLACQAGCSVPLELTVFFSRTEDARLVEEGATDGPRPPLLRMIEVPRERIMQRAMHFSGAHEMHDLSHTVFFDADLWFPPEFWAAYALAVESESPGYWSCRVMDVPSSDCDAFVQRWKEITEERLKQVTTGRRLDFQAGKAGHFQCIPRDLAAYPPDPAPSVIKTDLAFSAAAVDRSYDKRTDRRISKVPAYHLDHPYSWEGTGGLQL